MPAPDEPNLDEFFEPAVCAWRQSPEGIRSRVEGDKRTEGYRAPERAGGRASP
jgi:hypothetical protein